VFGTHDLYSEDALHGFRLDQLMSWLRFYLVCLSISRQAKESVSIGPCSCYIRVVYHKRIILSFDATESELLTVSSANPLREHLRNLGNYLCSFIEVNGFY
jgi:hypothetical protein